MRAKWEKEEGCASGLGGEWGWSRDFPYFNLHIWGAVRPEFVRFWLTVIGENVGIKYIPW